MSEFVYYFLSCLSEDAIAKADELKMNPHAHSYKSLQDPRRKGSYLLVVADRADGYILFSKLVPALDSLELEAGAPVHVIS